jgi:hypothetical protein
MDPKDQTEVNELKAAAQDVNRDISLAADEAIDYEETQDVKGRVAEFIARYEHVMKDLSPKDQKELVRTIGLKVKEMEEKLTKIRQAPE